MAQIQEKFIADDAVSARTLNSDTAGTHMTQQVGGALDVDVGDPFTWTGAHSYSVLPTSAASAAAPNDFVTFKDLSSLATGLNVKSSVRAATDGSDVDLTNDVSNGDTLDGVLLVTGDRILVKDQTDPIENGIYEVNVGAATRAADFDPGEADTSGSFCFVEEGTVNADTGWVCVTDGDPDPDTDANNWAQFTSSVVNINEINIPDELTVAAGDVTNQCIRFSLLTGGDVPSVPTEVDMMPIGAPAQDQGVDYTVRDVTGGSLDGWYIVWGTSPTAPGGGSFGTGGDNANPSTGLVGTILASDKLKLTYGV